MHDLSMFSRTTQYCTDQEKLIRWCVRVVDLEGNVSARTLTLFDINTMYPDRIPLEFGPHNQLEGDSGALFAMWLKSYTEEFCIDFLFYEDWRKIEKEKKDAAWEDIQRKFVMLSKYKKFVMKSLSKECKAYKMWLMRIYGGETRESIIAHVPDYISKEKWSAFVHLQLSDEEKRLQEGKQKKRHWTMGPIQEVWSPEKIDNSDHLDVEETEDVTEGRKRGKWVVKVINSNGNVREEHITLRDILMGMHQERVVLEFGPHNQPEGGSGGIFATWLGVYSTGFCKDFLCYEDWRKLEKCKKDGAWEEIQKRFYFDASNEKYKKFVMKSLSQKCKDYKIRLMKRYRRETLEETIANGPDLIPDEDWRAFVHLQFSDEKKKVRERNAKNRSYYKTPHTLGSKSIARKSKEVFLQEGKRPSREEIYLLSRKSQRTDKSFVNEEARNLSEKLKEKMTQNMENTSENNITSATNDVFAQVFGAERPGRVRCVGLGPTPSTFFQSDTASTSEVNDLRNQVAYLEAQIASMKGTNG